MRCAEGVHESEPLFVLLSTGWPGYTTCVSVFVLSGRQFFSAPIARGHELRQQYAPNGRAFFAEPQRGGGVAAPRGGGQEGRHLRFLPSCAPAGQASSVHFASGKSREFSREKSPFLFSQNVCTGIFARLNRVRISTGFMMFFGMKLIFSKVLKRLCFYVCNPYRVGMKRVIFV